MALSDAARIALNNGCPSVGGAVGDEVRDKLFDKTGTNTITGAQTFSSAVTLSGGASLSGTNTISGATEFTAAPTFTAPPIQSTQAARCTTQFDAVTGTTGTTLTNVVGMSVTVVSSGVYAFHIYLAGTATANSGAKFAIGGTATATSISYTGVNYNAGTTNAHTTTTTKGNAVGAATAVLTDATIDGTIVVNAGGTITLQAAQNAAHADTTSVYVNSYMILTRLA